MSKLENKQKRTIRAVLKNERTKRKKKNNQPNTTRKEKTNKTIIKGNQQVKTGGNECFRSCKANQTGKGPTRGVAYDAETLAR